MFRCNGKLDRRLGALIALPLLIILAVFCHGVKGPAPAAGPNPIPTITTVVTQPAYNPDDQQRLIQPPPQTAPPVAMPKGHASGHVQVHPYLMRCAVRPVHCTTGH